MPDIVPVEERIMIDWSDFELTDDGIAMRNKAIGEKMVVDFGYAMIGQGRLASPDEVYTLKSLVLPAAEVPIRRSVGVKATHYLDIFIDNKDFEDEIFCTEIGVFARLDEAAEYSLYGYSYATKGYEQIPPGKAFRRKYHIGANTHISRSHNIVVSYDDSNIYVPYEVFDATQPTVLVATVEHEFDYTPMLALFRTSNAFNVQPFGQGAFGGGPSHSLNAAFEVQGKQVKVYTVPGFEGTPEVVRHTKYQYAFLYPGSATNLLLIMR